MNRQSWSISLGTVLVAGFRIIADCERTPRILYTVALKDALQREAMMCLRI